MKSISVRKSLKYSHLKEKKNAFNVGIVSAKNIVLEGEILKT